MCEWLLGLRKVFKKNLIGFNLIKTILNFCSILIFWFKNFNIIFYVIRERKCMTSTFRVPSFHPNFSGPFQNTAGPASAMTSLLMMTKKTMTSQLERETSLLRPDEKRILLFKIYSVLIRMLSQSLQFLL